MESGGILIVSDFMDAHADRLITLLRSYGHEPVRLNFSDIPAGTSMSCTFDSDDWAGSIRIHANGRVIDIAGLRSVWWRKPGSFRFPERFRGQQREFAREETDHALRGLWSSLDCHWVSHPENIRGAGYKMEQLRRAARFGFDVPRTVVTTDPDTALAFFEECAGRMVYKVLSDPYLALRKRAEKGWDEPAPVRFVGTTLMTGTEMAMLDSIRSVPCQFQEYVPKRTELRVTVIGDEVFAAEIHSQDDERTMVDCRRPDADIPYRKAMLDEEIARRCHALTRSYGLNFGAIDLVRTPDGRHVFLEINPNGQFLFVEERVPELRMAEAMAASLIHGGGD